MVGQERHWAAHNTRVLLAVLCQGTEGQPPPAAGTALPTQCARAGLHSGACYHGQTCFCLQCFGYFCPVHRFLASLQPSASVANGHKFL